MELDKQMKSEILCIKTDTYNGTMFTMDTQELKERLMLTFNLDQIVRNSQLKMSITS